MPPEAKTQHADQATAAPDDPGSPWGGLGTTGGIQCLGDNDDDDDDNGKDDDVDRDHADESR